MRTDSSGKLPGRQSPILAEGRMLVGEDPVPLPAPDYRADEGAVFRFLGVVRRDEAGRALRGIRYSHYPAMLEKMAPDVAATARERFGPHRLFFYHRMGLVEVGVPSILVEVRTSHSREAFELGAFYLQQAKTALPIWKEPVYEAPSESHESS